jgi:hypothetical protein
MDFEKRVKLCLKLPRGKPMGADDAPRSYAERLMLVRARLMVRTVVGWTNGQSMGDISAPGSHCS